jgi:murein DD-endopeptidase MepM/ murein hydrolase activator NlpD
MTRETVRHFPPSARAAILAALLALVSVVTTVAVAAPPSKEDVERAKERLERIEDELAQIQEKLAVTQLRANEAAALVEERRGALEKVQAELARTEADLDRARARYDRVVQRLNERAVEAYMQGPASSIDFLLGAETVADLTDRLAYVDALAESDADLAVRVANLKNRLTFLEAKLEADRARKLEQLEAARAQEQDLLELFAEVERLLDEQRSVRADAERSFKQEKADFAEWLEEQEEAEAQALGGREWNGGGLGTYDHVLQRCPVEQPRAFGDGFGAPRYGGGYHLHKGVDIVAPMGTEILAPFDGLAYTSSNGLGGNVVFVVGSRGTVYNAHLSGYTASSNGSVSAGDVIGLVGSTGYSSTPHDHFEFHPNQMPGPWPASYYGYKVIEDAVNPYPLLVQACG